MNETTKLKPCPFCGCDKPISTCDGMSCRGRHNIWCPRCRIKTDYLDTHEAAIGAWNTRASEWNRQTFKCPAPDASPEPTDCNWPVCGCDPYADKVIEALQESGLLGNKTMDENYYKSEPGSEGLAVAWITPGGDVSRSFNWCKERCLPGIAPSPLFYKFSSLEFNLVAHLYAQRAWSEATFGPDLATARILDHIRKELAEIEAEPGDVSEWVDVVLLALDGAWRAGHTPEAIAKAIRSKQQKNESRQWPDWRAADPDKAIEHVKESSDKTEPVAWMYTHALLAVGRRGQRICKLRWPTLGDGWEETPLYAAPKEAE